MPTKEGALLLRTYNPRLLARGTDARPSELSRLSLEASKGHEILQCVRQLPGPLVSERVPAGAMRQKKTSSP